MCLLVESVCFLYGGGRDFRGWCVFNGGGEGLCGGVILSFVCVLLCFISATLWCISVVYIGAFYESLVGESAGVSFLEPFCV